MALPTSYKTGTISVTAGSKTVTGSGTLWLAAGLSPGDVLAVQGLGVSIEEIVGNSEIRLAFNWPGSALSGAAYEIRFTPDATRVLTASREALRRMAEGDFIALDGITIATGPAGSNASFSGGVLTLPRGRNGAVNFGDLTIITGAAGTQVQYFPETETLRIPRGADGGVQQAALDAEAAARANGVVLGGTVTLVNEGGAVDAYTANLPAALADAGITPANVRRIAFRVTAENSGAVAPTLSIGEAAPVPIYTIRNSVPAAGVLRLNRYYEAVFSSARWRLVSEVGAADIAEAVAPLTPTQITVQPGDAAALRNSQKWTAPNVYRRINSAVISFGPAGIASPMVADVETATVTGGVRLRWHDQSGLVFERLWDGAVWGAWTRGFSAGDLAAETLAREELAAAHANLRVELAERPDAGADVGRALIMYEGDERAALVQRPDGLDFIPSAALLARMGGGGGGGISAPAGGWAGQDVEGVTHFTGPAGCGLIDRYRLVSGAWRPTDRAARVICHYGQSNAGVTLMGETLHWEQSPIPHHTLTLNDGSSGLGGVRGWMGSAPSVVATGLAEAVERANVQSVVSAVAARLAVISSGPQLPVSIVRSEARGGMPFIGTEPGEGIWKDSLGNHPQCYLNLIDSISKMVAFGEAAGFSIPRIYIPFTHQEADRNETRAAYLANWLGFKADVEGALAPLGKQVIWLLDQASGTAAGGFGGAWPCRMSVYDATLPANGGANAYMTMPRYHLEMGRTTGATWDNIHHSYRSRVLQGEMIAHSIAEIEAGRDWRCAWPVSATIAGAGVVIDFDSITPLMLDRSFCKVRDDLGFVVSGRTVTGVQQTGPRQITVSCNSAPAAGATVSYAYRIKDGADIEDEWAVSTGALREVWQQASRFVSGARLVRPALAFQITI